MISKEKTVKFTLRGAGWIVVAFVLTFPAVLLFFAVPFIREHSITEVLIQEWAPDAGIYGILPFLITSIIIAIVSTMLSFFMSLGIALFIYNYKNSPYGKTVLNIIQYMTGIPTVVYGFAGIILLVPFIRQYTESPSGYCILTIVLVLSILVLPTITLYIHSSFSMVDRKSILAAQSLGASGEQLCRYILLPESVRGLVVAVILGFSRALSDTMIPLMLSGNALQFPKSFLISARALTSHMALVLPGEYDGMEFRVIFFIAILLLSTITIFNLMINYLERNNG